jgi:hypothetical protein
MSSSAAWKAEKFDYRFANLQTCQETANSNAPNLQIQEREAFVISLPVSEQKGSMSFLFSCTSVPYFVRSLRRARTAIVQCLILWWSSGLKAVLRFYARDIRAIGEVINV